MKKILFLIGGLMSFIAINAQTLGYGDTAILLSSEDNNGTARYNAMGGAFGALGGDLSAGDINPAGLAVFKHSNASITFGLRSTDINTSFYGGNVINSNNYFNATQAGGVLVFNTGNPSNWQKIALGINYKLARDYENSYRIAGVSDYAPLTEIYDSNVVYKFIDEQRFDNITNGKNDRVTFSFAAQANDKLFIGASINTYNTEFSQFTYATELNNDGNGNTFDVAADQELLTYGSGVSIGVGAILKPSQELRLGLAFQTPTWYSLSEEHFFADHELITNGVSEFRRHIDSGTSVLDYDITTPSKFTGSFAYIFGKEGLISVDYVYKNYKNVKLNPSQYFANDNNQFLTDLKNTSTLKIGTEWRIDNISLRAGYHFEESPYEKAINTDNIRGYSFGIGFKFKGNVKLDLAYQNANNTDVYGFLYAENANNPGVNAVDAAELDITHDKFTVTLVIGL